MNEEKQNITPEPAGKALTDSTGYAPDVIEWTFGQEVFLKCDADQKKGMVTGISLRPNGSGYNISWGDRTEAFYYADAATTERDFQPA